MNKEQERRAVDDLRRLDPAFPTGAIEPGEAPDFIVRGDDGCVGIEVCEYFRTERPLGSHPKEQESLTHQVTTRATALAIERGLPACWSVVSFADGVRLLKRDVEPTAEAIVTAMERAQGTFIRNDGDLPVCIDDIVVHPLAAKHEPFVSSIGTAWAAPLVDDELTRIVRGKEEKLAAYRTRCDTVWLLIVVDGFQLSSMTERPTALSPIATSFDRVLVLHDRTTVLTMPRA
jgi:hypothetical protein